MFTTYIDVDFNKTDKIDIDFSKYPNLMNGICMTNFRCNNDTCDLSTYHFIKYVRVIGDYFMSECFCLTEIDLSPLSHVTSIGNYFLVSCTILTKMDFLPVGRDSYGISCGISYGTPVGRGFLQISCGSPTGPPLVGIPTKSPANLLRNLLRDLFHMSLQLDLILCPIVLD